MSAATSSATSSEFGRPQSQTCAADILCVSAFADERDNVVFRATNRSAFPVTLRLSVSPHNLQSAAGDAAWRTIPPHGDILLLEYRRLSDEVATDYRYRFDWAIGDPHAVHDDAYVYRFPYGASRSYRVLQGYGSRFSHTGREHYAVDFDMPRGTPVHAARSGVVARVVERHGEGCWAARCADKANLIVVLHDDGTTGEYYHLARDSAVVKVGERVARGQPVAASGNSGHTTMPHLHFGVYIANEDGRARSLRVRFDGAAGPVDAPRHGARYEARERAGEPR